MFKNQDPRQTEWQNKEICRVYAQLQQYQKCATRIFEIILVLLSCERLSKIVYIIMQQLFKLNSSSFSQNPVHFSILCAMYTCKNKLPLSLLTIHFMLKKNSILKTYHSQTLKLLSSDVLTNLLFSSTNTMVLTAPKCLSYSCTISPLRISHYN